jgi:hypothetical protein
VCVDNDGYEASLERNKIYPVLPDKAAEKDGDFRIVDESGEDYLFSADRFVAIDVRAAVKASLVKASLCTSEKGSIPAGSDKEFGVSERRAVREFYRRHRR